MPPTVSQVQQALGRRVGPWVGLADLGEALGYALTALGLPPAAYGTAADLDLAGVLPAALPALLDITEWRMVEAMAGNASDGELRRLGIGDDPDAVRRALHQRAARLFGYVQRAYGVGLPTLSVGTIDANFQQQDAPGDLDF